MLTSTLRVVVRKEQKVNRIAIATTLVLVMLVAGSSAAWAIQYCKASSKCWGSEKPQLIIGSNGPDRIYGLGGDSISGEFGNDKLYGGDGHDQNIYGGGGHDLLRGGNGNDWLVGDRGKDTLVGGPGYDTCDKQKNDTLKGCEDTY